MRYFVAVADALSFTKGAEKLHLAQPSLTRQIKDLEAEIEVRLIDRTKPHVTLTPEGRSFLADAKRVLALSTQMVEDVQQLSRTESPALNLGYVANLFYDLLPVTLASFRRSFPAVPVNLFDMTCGDQLRALEDGKIDLGFVGLREPVQELGLQFRSIASYETCVVVSEKSALAKKSIIQLKDLKSTFFIGYVGDELSWLSALAETNLPAREVQPQSASGCRCWTDAHSSCRRGTGRCVVARAGQENPSRQRGLSQITSTRPDGIVYRLEGGQLLQCLESLHQHRERPGNPHALKSLC